jgi:transposase
MGKAYGDDLRRKFLLAYDQGEDTLEELADRFLVSVGWAKKISAQRNRNGQAESPDLNPIEKAWAKLKQLLRAVKARSKDALDQAITDALPSITPGNAQAWFRLALDGLQ